MTWTDAKNERRCDLIDAIADWRDGEEPTPTDMFGEMLMLQDEMLEHRKQVAPLPIAEVRALHESLKGKA